MNLFTGSLLAILLFAICDLSAQAITGTSWSETQKTGSGMIRILYLEEAGFAYKDAEGQLTGVEIEIFKQFLNFVQKTKKVTINAEFVGYSDFAALYNATKTGRGGVFGLANITITAERSKELKFSPPYLTNIAVLVTHASIADVKSLGEAKELLSGFNGFSYKGTMHEERMKNLKRNFIPDLKLVDVNSDSEMIEKMLSDKKSVAYTDVSIYWLASQEGKPVKRHAVGDDAGEEFGFAMPLSSDWDSAMKEFFQFGAGGYRANPAYSRILRKHLGDEVTKMMELNIKKNQK